MVAHNNQICKVRENTSATSQVIINKVNQLISFKYVNYNLLDFKMKRIYILVGSVEMFIV